MIEEKQGNSKKNWLVKKENSDQKTEHDDLIELGTGHTVQAVVGHEDDEVPPPRTELVDCNNITLLNYNVNKANIKLQFKICMASPG